MLVWFYKQNLLVHVYAIRLVLGIQEPVPAFTTLFANFQHIFCILWELHKLFGNLCFYIAILGMVEVCVSYLFYPSQDDVQRLENILMFKSKLKRLYGKYANRFM